MGLIDGILGAYQSMAMASQKMNYDVAVASKILDVQKQGIQDLVNIMNNNLAQQNNNSIKQLTGMGINIDFYA